MNRRDVVIVEDRRKAAAILRRLASGRLHVDDFEEQFDELDWSDRAIERAYFFAWTQYCDYRTEYMTGPWKITRETRRYWARWILYLMTDDQPYAYCGRVRSWFSRLMRRPTDLLVESVAYRDIWPFVDPAHLRRCEANFLSR